MNIGIVGLGRMGMNMTRRLLRAGHAVGVYNRSHEKTEIAEQEGADGAGSPSDLAARLPCPRVVWIMLPAGKAVEDHIDIFSEILAPGDILVDGGNSYYRDSIRHAGTLKKKGIEFIDAGVSGGIWGLERGYCIMAGGSEQAFHYLQPILEALAPDDGCLYCGPAGAGHFVKMVHNGIEYAMMQAYGEGFALLEGSPYGKDLRLEEIARLWNRGSVVRSWLLELLESALARNPRLDDLEAYVDDSGEGRWAVRQAVDSGVPAPAIALSLFQRFSSRGKSSFSDRVLAALRREFGGHDVVVRRGRKGS